MKIEALPIHGALLITPTVFSDDRGYFKEVFAARRYEEAIGPVTFVQDNVSQSMRGVLRGLHAAPGMAKLVQALDGEVFDVIVDIRPDSPSFRRWHAVNLTSENHAQIFVPDGCLHGFQTISEQACVLYKQSSYYDPSVEIGVAWNDPELAVQWPLQDVLLSPKDSNNPTLREALRL